MPCLYLEISDFEITHKACDCSNSHQVIIFCLGFQYDNLQDRTLITRYNEVIPCPNAAAFGTFVQIQEICFLT